MNGGVPSFPRRTLAKTIAAVLHGVGVKDQVQKQDQLRPRPAGQPSAVTHEPGRSKCLACLAFFGARMDWRMSRAWIIWKPFGAERQLHYLPDASYMLYHMKG